MSKERSILFHNSKIYDPNKLFLTQLSNENGTNQYKSPDDYYQQVFKMSDLSLRAVHESDQLLKDTFKEISEKIFNQNITIAKQSQEVDDQLILNETDQEHVYAIQQQLIRKDLEDLDKKRRGYALKLVDIEQEYQELRVDQTKERLKLDERRNEITKNLLELEDRIQVLKQKLAAERKNHHFSTNTNLHNSKLELSYISIQKDQVSQWEVDPERNKFRQEFVEKQMKVWRDMQKMREKRIQEIQNQIKQEEEKIKKLESEQKESQQQKKKSDISDRLQQLKDLQVKRKEELDQANERLQKVKAQELLVQKYAIQDAKFIEEEMQKRKERLQKIKESRKPINADELNEHDQKFSGLQKEKALEREHKIKEREANWNQFRAQYFSENYRKVQEDVKIHKAPYEEMVRKAQDKLEKQKMMEKKIKEKYLPKIDPELQKEMMEKIDKIEHQIDFKSYVDISNKVKSKRIFNGVKVKSSERRQHLVLEPLSQDQAPLPASPKAVGLVYLRVKGRFNKKGQIQSQSPKKMDNEVTDNDQRDIIEQQDHIKQYKSEAQLKKMDYLKEMRIKRQNHPLNPFKQWEQLVTKQAKIEDDKGYEQMLLQEAKKIEKAAKRKEQILRAEKHHDYKLMYDEEQVDKMLLNSIKTKLLALDRKANIEFDLKNDPLPVMKNDSQNTRQINTQSFSSQQMNNKNQQNESDLYANQSNNLENSQIQQNNTIDLDPPQDQGQHQQTEQADYEYEQEYDQDEPEDQEQ